MVKLKKMRRGDSFRVADMDGVLTLDTPPRFVSPEDEFRVQKVWPVDPFVVEAYRLVKDEAGTIVGYDGHNGVYRFDGQTLAMDVEKRPQFSDKLGQNCVRLPRRKGRSGIAYSLNPNVSEYAKGNTSLMLENQQRVAQLVDEYPEQVVEIDGVKWIPRHLVLLKLVEIANERGRNKTVASMARMPHHTLTHLVNRRLLNVIYNTDIEAQRFPEDVVKYED